MLYPNILTKISYKIHKILNLLPNCDRRCPNFRNTWYFFYEKKLFSNI